MKNPPNTRNPGQPNYIGPVVKPGKPGRPGVPGKPGKPSMPKPAPGGGLIGGRGAATPGGFNVQAFLDEKNQARGNAIMKKLNK